MTRLALAGALALALAVTACGDSGDSGPATSQASGSGSPSASVTAAPTAPAAASTSPASCSLLPTVVPPPAEGNRDLATKPVVPAGTGTPPTEVTVSDLVVGTGQEAFAGDGVAVKYVGAIYATGREFDSSWSRGPDETLPFGLCQEGVVPGFAVGPIGMKVGGRRSIVIPPRFGYGSAGQSGAGIAGTDTLVFIVDLVSIDS